MYLRLSTLSTSDEWNGWSSAVPPEVHNQFFGFAGIQQERILPAPALQVDDLRPVGFLVAVGD